MTTWAIVPARPLEEGKSRLAEALTPEERQRLNLAFFRRTLDVTAQVVGRERTLVISRSEPLLEIARSLTFETLLEAAPYGLNRALTQAALAVGDKGADRVLSISCDLPFLIPDDLRAMLSVAEAGDGLAIASDRAGTGTNALVVSPVGAIPYLYGEGSFAAHLKAAEAAGLALNVVRRAGLSFDIDTPDDFEQMEEIKREANPAAIAASSGCAFRPI
jgi:2-phospho-L-lactate guanylyltransferase